MNRRYDRESAEFGRVLAFSDGLLAIAAVAERWKPEGADELLFG